MAGGVILRQKLSGTPEALRSRSQATVRGFSALRYCRHQNMRLASSFLLGAIRGGHRRQLSDLLCESPVGRRRSASLPRVFQTVHTTAAYDPHA